MEKRTIEVVLSSVGKTNIDKKTTSKLTGINEGSLTTSLYYYSEKSKKIIGLPINDKTFNYDYFNSKIYNNLENRRVKLFLDIYKNKSKEILIIYKIE
ncbi:hypothetical protein [Flavobacterium rhamnosiphilum]|nr:hypothetical protein [Flavobacterium rhamnosiphilum]